MNLERDRIKQAVHDWQGSGQSIKQFCQLNNIKPATFHYWKKKLMMPEASNFQLVNMSDGVCFVEILHASGHRLVFNQQIEVSYLKNLLS